MDNIIVVKNDDYIIISHKGKKLFLSAEKKLFTFLRDKNTEQIKDWFINLRKGGELDG